MQNSFSYLKELIQDNPDFKFEGKIISYDLAKEILGQIEQIIISTSETTGFQRKAYHILVDLMQGMTSINYSSNFSNIYVKIHIDKFYIVTESTISIENKSKFADTIDKLNGMLDEKDRLKNYYRELIRNGSITNKGGGEIGLIEIIRKSNNKLLYDFTGIENLNYKVSLITTINIT